jgi:type IV secretion system protein VirB4
VLDKNLLPNIDRIGSPNPDLVDHIPIACHYDADTLLTKDGELLQIIEISGYESKTTDFSAHDIRTHIRDTLTKNIPDYNFAVYIHTVRSRKNLMPEGTEPIGLADQLNKKWCKKNNWDKQLINTIYLSIVIKAKKGGNVSLHNILSLQQLTKVSEKKLAGLKVDLDGVVGKILNDLQYFGARKLTILKTPDGYISEQLGFYHSLIHLNQKRTPVPVKDLSEYLASTNINFHFNTVEVINNDEVDYAAIYTVKPTSELSIEKLNDLLQMGSNFIITQVLYFVPADEAKQKFSKTYDFLKLSRSKVAIEKSGLDSFMKNASGMVTDYCLQQTTIMIHSDDIEFFLQKIKTANHILQELGLVVVREDFFMPKLFWGQLPGNFRYLEKARMEYLVGKRVGDFSSIHHHLAGSYKGSKWGPPVSLLRSFEGTPFFFNFHDDEGNGNTLIIGPHNSGKTILKNFFLAQAVKLNPRIIYLDMQGSAKNFIEAIGGQYQHFNENNLGLKINPFNPALYAKDANLFKHWLMAAIMPAAYKIPKYDEFFAILASKLFEGPNIPDKIAMIKEIVINTGDQTLIDGFSKILGNEVFAKLFTQDQGELGIFNSSNVIGLNLADLCKDEARINSYLGLLLVSLLEVLDGRPTIIVFNRFSKIYDMEYFAPIFAKWLDALTQRNALAVCSDIHVEKLDKHPQFSKDVEHFGSKIFLSDKYIDKYFRKAFKLSDEELYKIKSYDLERRMFLLKQKEISILIALVLDDMKEEVKLLGKAVV